MKHERAATKSSFGDHELHPNWDYADHTMLRSINRLSVEDTSGLDRDRRR